MEIVTINIEVAPIVIIEYQCRTIAQRPSGRTCKQLKLTVGRD